MRLLVNLVAFQVGWFSCVMGAAYGFYWLGPVTVLAIFGLHLYLTGCYRRESLIGLVFLAAGFVVDTVLTASGVYSPAENLLPRPFSPPWLLALWLNLGIIFNVSLRWLHGRYRFAAIMGGLGGCAAYYSGYALGAMSFHIPFVLCLLVIGCVWAVVTPLLFYAVALLNHKYTVECTSRSS